MTLSKRVRVVQTDTGTKIRRFKRTKVAEGIYASPLMYLKFFSLWALVITADFVLEFRFEFLWPTWLFLYSSYDLLRCQGLAVALVFVLFAVTSDMLCYFFIPVQWLFVCATTYICIQYMCYTDRGLCFPTILLLLLFIYIEFSVRHRHSKDIPFNIDICRPFASHCVGYPVVTMSYSFKRYISCKLRLRRQEAVQKENKFYVQLLEQALPIALQTSLQEERKSVEPNNLIETDDSHLALCKSQKHDNNKRESQSSTSTCRSNKHSYVDTAVNVSDIDTILCSDSSISLSFTNSLSSNVYNNLPSNEPDTKDDGEPPVSIVLPRPPTVVTHVNSNSSLKAGGGKSVVSGKRKHKVREDGASDVTSVMKEEGVTTLNNTITRLESEVKKYRCELNASRSQEQQLRQQLTKLTRAENDANLSLLQLRNENDILQNRVQSLQMSRNEEKCKLEQAGIRLCEERNSRQSFERLSVDHKRAEEAANCQLRELQSQLLVTQKKVGECGEHCRMSRKDLERELRNSKADLRLKDEKFKFLEQEIGSMRRDSEEEQNLRRKCESLQEKNATLECNLEAETKYKMSFLLHCYNTSRELEHVFGTLHQKDSDIQLLKAKVAELTAIMPSVQNGLPSVASSIAPHQPYRDLGSFSSSALPHNRNRSGNRIFSHQSLYDAPVIGTSVSSASSDRSGSFGLHNINLVTDDLASRTLADHLAPVTPSSPGCLHQKNLDLQSMKAKVAELTSIMPSLPNGLPAVASINSQHQSFPDLGPFSSGILPHNRSRTGNRMFSHQTIYDVPPIGPSVSVVSSDRNNAFLHDINLISNDLSSHSITDHLASITPPSPTVQSSIPFQLPTSRLGMDNNFTLIPHNGVPHSKVRNDDRSCTINGSVESLSHDITTTMSNGLLDNIKNCSSL